MKLSKETVEILQNFATINPQLAFMAKDDGDSVQLLKTRSEANNIFAVAEINDVIDSSFGISDVKEFLSVISLVGDDSEFTHDTCIKISNGKSRAKYFPYDISMINYPDKTIKMPNCEVNFSIDDSHINTIRKGSAILGLATIAIAGKGGEVTMNVYDPKNPTSNEYSIVIDEDNDCKENFNFILEISNLKMISGEYDVSLSTKNIAQFKNKNIPVTYWVALEQTSTFGE